MADDLGDAIAELKRVSQGRIMKNPLPNDALLASFESDLGVRLHQDHRRFLMEVSNVFYGSKEPLTVTEENHQHGDLRRVFISAREIGMPVDWMPICEDNSDLYCLLPSGEVRFLSHDGPTNESWSTLAEWMREVWIRGR